MITEYDLQAAIAECQGERHPNANTCIKLAAYYTILDHLRERENTTAPAYSYASEPPSRTETRITFDSGTEFSAEINGRDAADVWGVMDELMSVLQATQPRLYNGVLAKINSL